MITTGSIISGTLFVNCDSGALAIDKLENLLKLRGANTFCDSNNSDKYYILIEKIELDALKAELHRLQFQLKLDNLIKE